MEDLKTYKSRVELYRARAKSFLQEAEAVDISERRRRHLLHMAKKYEQIADGIECAQLGKG
jgi:hypothetical protein